MQHRGANGSLAHKGGHLVSYTHSYGDSDSSGTHISVKTSSVQMNVYAAETLQYTMMLRPETLFLSYSHMTMTSSNNSKLIHSHHPYTD